MSTPSLPLSLSQEEYTLTRHDTMHMPWDEPLTMDLNETFVLPDVEMADDPREVIIIDDDGPVEVATRGTAMQLNGEAYQSRIFDQVKSEVEAKTSIWNTPVVRRADSGKKNAGKKTVLKKNEMIIDWTQFDTDSEDDLVIMERKLAKGNEAKKAIMKAKMAEAPKDEIEEEVNEIEQKGRGPLRMRWCFTWNNPDIDCHELATRLDKVANIKGYVMQMEAGNDGTRHIQGYVEFKKAVWTSGVKTAIGHTVHCTAAAGTKAQNIAYCTKIDSRVDDGYTGAAKGTCAGEDAKRAGQGRRTDIDRFAEEVLKTGGITVALIDESPGMCMKYMKQANTLAEYRKRVEAEEAELAMVRQRIADRRAGIKVDVLPRNLILLFGPSAVGKTTMAIDYSVEKYDQMPYKKQGDSIWWCSYEGQKAVLIDEWRRDFVKGQLQGFNDVTNRGPYRGEVKGGQTTVIAEEMIFTSNRHPADIYNTTWRDASYRAMARRFAQVCWWNDDKECTQLFNPGEKPETEDEEELEAWAEANTAWVRFWTWKTRSSEAGDTFDPNVDNYFTL